MIMPKGPFNVGDVVAVKAGVTDADMGGDIGGWQGRVIHVYAEGDDAPTVDIEWDSVTLRGMPPAMIEACEKQGLDWSQMCVYASEVAPAQPRDRTRDVTSVKAELERTYVWASIGGEQGKRIGEVVNSAPARDDLSVITAWHEYLRERLTVPFDAVRYEYGSGPVPAGARVTVVDLAGVDDLYGVLVSVTYGRRSYDLPLTDLKADDKNSTNYQLTDDYAVWFANR